MAKQSASELRAKAEELLRQAEQQEVQQREEVFAQITGLLSEAGLTPQDYLAYAKPAKAAAGAKLPAKYRYKDGSEWSGRGRPPAWVRGLGKTPEAVERNLRKYEIG